MKTYVFFENEQ